MPIGEPKTEQEASPLASTLKISKGASGSDQAAGGGRHGLKPVLSDQAAPIEEVDWLNEERMTIYGWALFLGIPVNSKAMQSDPRFSTMTRHEFLRLIEALG